MSTFYLLDLWHGNIDSICKHFRVQLYNMKKPNPFSDGFGFFLSSFLPVLEIAA